MAAGELRRDLDPDTVVSLLIGTYLGGVVRRGRVDQAFSEKCVDLMWGFMNPSTCVLRATPGWSFPERSCDHSGWRLRPGLGRRRELRDTARAARSRAKQVRGAMRMCASR
jgi:hypothetical protein